MGDNFVMEEIAVYFKFGQYNYWHMTSWEITRGFVCNLATEVRDVAFFTGERIAIRGLNNSSMFQNLLFRYGVERWPGQTLPIPNDSSTEEECNAFCNELLQCMHRATVDMILTDREPPELDPLLETRRLHDRLHRASQGGKPPRRA
jgi:hypothetical protein